MASLVMCEPSSMEHLPHRSLKEPSFGKGTIKMIPLKLDDLPWWKQCLLSLLKLGEIPQHIAILPDGHRRYARKQRITKQQSQADGWDATMRTISLCYALGIKEVTTYVISPHNVKRTDAEVVPMFQLVAAIFEGIVSKIELFEEKGIQMKFIFDPSLLPEEFQEIIEEISQKTCRIENPKMIWYCTCIYLSRNEITASIKEVARKAQRGVIAVKDIDEKAIEEHLVSGKYVRPIEYVIRSSGETRLSDFYLWHIGKAVIHFVDVLWPEFSIWEFSKAILFYQFVKIGVEK